MLPLHLDWSAPLECPTVQQVEQELSRITRPRPGRVLVPLEARASITRAGESYHLALQLTRNGELSEAHFDSRACAPLRKAATLVLALAYGDGIEIKEDSGDASAEDTAGSKHPPLQPATVTASAPARDEAERDTERRRLAEYRSHFTPWVAATFASGFIGDSAVGAEAGLGWGGRYLSVLGRLSAFPPGTAATSGGVSAELSAVTGGLGGCAAWPSVSVTLQGCLTFEAGALRAHSNGAVVEGSVTAPWFALNPALAFMVPISRPFALRAELGALIPFTSPHFDVTSFGTVYATSRFAPRASLGISVTL
jgi:hypothetical protein